MTILAAMSITNPQFLAACALLVALLAVALWVLGTVLR